MSCHNYLFVRFVSIEHQYSFHTILLKKICFSASSAHLWRRAFNVTHFHLYPYTYAFFPINIFNLLRVFFDSVCYLILSLVSRPSVSFPRWSPLHVCSPIPSSFRQRAQHVQIVAAFALKHNLLSVILCRWYPVAPHCIVLLKENLMKQNLKIHRHAF